jgi:hypothetical protein
MAKKAKKDLEKIPLILEKVVALVDKEIDNFLLKDELTSEDARNVINYSSLLVGMYKDYRAECLQIKKELKELPKEDILKIVKAEVNDG